MRLRTTVVLLLLAASLFAYLKFVDSKKTATGAAMVKGSFLPTESVDRDQVTGITIRNSEGLIEMAGNQQTWRLTAPVKDSVEPLMLTSLFTKLEGLTGKEVQGVKDFRPFHKEWGVSKGEFSIKLDGPQPVELLIGKETATEGKVYARVEGKDTVYVISNQLRDDLKKGVKAWRNLRLTDINMMEVGRLTLQTPKGEVEVERNGQNWSFTKPFKARGDNEKIGELISALTTLQVADFIMDSKDVSAFGLAEPRATITLLAVDQPAPVVLQLGALKPAPPEAEKDKAEAEKPEGEGEPAAPRKKPGTYMYAKLSTRDGILVVPAALQRLIGLQPNDLRDRSVIRVQPDIVDRITIESARGKVVLSRQAESWVRKVDAKTDAPVNSAAAERLLIDLVQAKSVRPVADMASDLRAFGLDKPQISVTLSSFSTEGSPESPPGDQPIVKLLLGDFEGDAGYAKLDDEPFIIAVPSSLLDTLWTDPLQWQDLRITNLDEEKVVGLEFSGPDRPTAAYTLGGDKKWKPAQGDGAVNQVLAQTVVNNVARLRAVRWVGATDPVRHGFEKPRLTVRYTLANKQTGRIVCGGPSPEEMWYAKVDGMSGTFVMTKLDFEVFSASLADTPKPAGAAAPVNGTGLPGAAPAPAGARGPSSPGAPGAPEVPVIPPPAVPESPSSPEPPKPTEVTPAPPRPAAISNPAKP